MTTIKLLWVDNDLFEDLNELRITLYLSDDYEADFALNATEGFNRLRENTYDIVTVDLRLPPGPHNAWLKYAHHSYEEYGCALLKEISEQRDTLFAHLSNTRFGVYSIEDPRDVPRELFEPPVGISHGNYCQKTDRAGDDEFFDFLRKLRASCSQ